MSTVITSKERIFQEAALLFQSKGYAATSIRELADKVGLKPSSFYSHISSKEEILKTICQRAGTTFANGLEEIIARNGTAFESLTAIIDLHITVAFEDPSAITVFNDEWRHLTGEALQEFRANRKHYQQSVTGLIRQAISDKGISENDPNVIFNTLIGATRWLHFIKAPALSTRERIRGQVRALLLFGMKGA